MVAVVDDRKNCLLLLEDQAEVVVEATMQLISRAYVSSKSRKRSCPRRKSAY